MKVKRSCQQDGSIRLEAQTSAFELRDALDYAYRAFSESIGLKPSPGQTIEEAAQATLGLSDLTPQIQPYLEQRLIALAVDKSGIFPAFLPKTAALSQPKSKMGICLECNVTPKPAFELSSYDPVSISVVKPVMFEEDITREMAMYENVLDDFDDPDKREKLRNLIVQKIEETNAQTFLNQKRQAASIELAKRLEGSIPDEILRSMFMELLEGLKTQLKSQGTPFANFLEEHGGEENVNMLLMWQARESLRQGYALDALFRHRKMKITEADVDSTACAIANLADPIKARENARAMGKMYAVKEAAQRFKATDWLVETAEITIRDQSPLEN